MEETYQQGFADGAANEREYVLRYLNSLMKDVETDSCAKDIYKILALVIEGDGHVRKEYGASAAER